MVRTARQISDRYLRVITFCWCERTFYSAVLSVTLTREKHTNSPSWLRSRGATDAGKNHFWQIDFAVVERGTSEKTCCKPS